MIKRTHMRQFIALAETGSFTAAAKRLNVTQPTLSSAMAELERLVGAPLILRDRRGCRLTEAGNRLLRHARTIEQEFRLALAPSEPPARRAAPPLRLGVVPTLATAMLARLCHGHDHERPLTLLEGSDAELRRRLAGGQLDVALTLLRPGERAGAVLDEGYAMLLADDHPLAESSSVTPEDLAGETMIARRSCEILAETSRFFTGHGVRPDFFLRSANDDRCLAMVRAGMGMTTAPCSLAIPGVIAVAVSGYDFRRRLGLICTGGQAPPAALAQAWAATAESGYSA